MNTTITLAKTAADLLTNEQPSAVLPSAPVLHVDAPAPDVRSNMPQDAFGATIMGLMDAKELAGTGVLMIVATFGNGDDSRLASLMRTLATLGPKDSARDATLTWFYDHTTEGHNMRARYNVLENTKDAEEIDERRAIKARQNHINLMLQNAVETMAGIDALRAAGCSVEIEQITGTSVRQCLVKRKGETREKTFSIKALRSVPTLKDIDSMKTKDLLEKAKAAGNAKVDTPNDKATAASPNGEQIEPTKIGATIKALDTTLANYVEPKTGQFQGLSDNNRKELYLLWGFLNATLTEIEKEQARVAYMSDAAKQESANVTLNAAAAAAAQLKQIEADKASAALAAAAATATVTDVPAPATVETPNVELAKAVEKADNVKHNKARKARKAA